MAWNNSGWNSASGHTGSWNSGSGNSGGGGGGWSSGGWSGATAHPAEAVAEAVDGETKRRLALPAPTAVPVYISIVLVPAVRTIYLPVLWLQLLLLLLEGVAMAPL